MPEESRSSDDPDIHEPDEGVVVDQLPADLDATAATAIYEFPNNSKRRIASILYLVTGMLCIGLGLGVESPLVNRGLTVAGVGLVVFAIYSFVVAVPTAVDETEALTIAAAAAGYPAGPAAAQMVWRGWRSRPAWRILIYSAEPQPTRRGLVLVDGVSGAVIEQLIEDNPEDWTELAP